MNNDKKLTHAELLIDTLEFYGEDPEGRRAVIAQGTLGPICRYFIKDKAGVRKCAIGRLVSDEVAEKLPAQDVACPEVQRMLPTEVTDLRELFLLRLQALHDKSDNWRNWNEMAFRVGMVLDAICDAVGELPESLFIGPFMKSLP